MKFFLQHIFWISLFIIAFISCREDEENNVTPTPDSDSLVVSNLNLKGYVQKGPFINGTAITVSELSKKLISTGKNFNTQIIDNKGSFSIKDISLRSEYVQLMADGFYFDEVKGEKSAAQLTMYALANVEDISSVNVNLLSHLEKERVIYLIQEEEQSFAEAKKQAQQEILAIFGIVKADIASAELLDISQEGEDNAILLAISAILQAHNTVAELSELLANIITDIREDGKLDSESNKEKIRQQAMSLNLSRIRGHLIKRYEELGVNATIANFEKYIDNDGDGILNKDEDDTPDEFVFTTQKDVAVDTKIVSDEITIAGLKAGGVSDIYVTNATLFINGTAIPDSTAQVKNGDKIKLQLTSSSQYADTVVASLIVGYLTSYFTVITDDYKADSFSFTAQKDVAVDSFYISNIITVNGLPHPTPATIENGMIIKNGVELPTDATSVKTGDILAVRLLSSNQYFTKTSARLDINGISSAFEITTDDYKPDDFSFTAVENAKRDSVYISNTVTLSGLLHSTPINLDQGILIVNNQEITANTTVVTPGDRVAIKLTSTSSFKTITTAKLSIGSTNEHFSIITEIDPWKQKAVYPGNAYYGLAGFSIGNKIYVGTGYGYGNSYNNNYEKEFYEYDPNTNKWTKLTDFAGEARAFAIGFSIGDKGYIGLGASDEYYNDFWEYDPATDMWTQIANFPGTARKDATAFTVESLAYVGLGEDNSNFYKDFWKYNPSVNSWSQIALLGVEGRTLAISFTIENKGYVGNGTNGVSHFNDLWEYDHSKDQWVEKQAFENVILDSSFGRGVSFEINGFGYTNFNKYWSKLYLFNPSNNKWIDTKYITPLSSEGTILGLSVKQKGYVLSGGHAPGVNLWEFTPPQE